MAPRSVTIVGASLAGLRGAEALRRAGYEGPVTLVGAEDRLPYDRPPLSKQVLAGEWEPDRATLTTDADLAELGIEVRTGTTATGLDLDARRLHLGDESLDVDAVMIATGARPRNLPGLDDLDSAFTLRTLDDAIALRSALDAGPSRVVVVGAGFIGAEVAATARGRGLDVTMVDPLPAPLARVLGPEIGSVVADLHRDHGVDVRCGVGVDGVDGDGRVERVRLDDGTTVDADVVVVGIGVIPNTEWLEGSGLTLDDGVVCDATCLAGACVTAAGDVARWPNPAFAGELMRVEHWDNAVDQGPAAARRLLAADDEAEPFAPVPFFWSDQFDRKIQLAGRVRPDDEMTIVDGSFEERRFVAVFGREGRLVGALGVNRPRHVIRLRMMIGDGASYADALDAA